LNSISVQNVGHLTRFFQAAWRARIKCTFVLFGFFGAWIASYVCMFGSALPREHAVADQAEAQVLVENAECRADVIGGWPTFTFPCKGGNDEVGGHGWKIGTQAALVPTFAKPAKVGQPPEDVPSAPNYIPELHPTVRMRKGWASPLATVIWGSA
jgi:hypothetical protein